MSLNPKTLIGLFVGLAALSALFAWQGLSSVGTVFSTAGWPILLICLFSPLDQFLGAEAWRRLFPPGGRRPRILESWLASWMGSSVNTLLPVASIGGEVIKARIIILKSYSAIDAVSTMVVDKTVQAIVVLIWSLVGIAMLVSFVPDKTVITSALGGAALLGLGIAGFIVVQVRGGASFVARSAAKTGKSSKWQGLIENAEELDIAIKALYRVPVPVIIGIALRLLARVLLVGEILFASYLMGQPLGLEEAILLKGLVSAVRGMSFAVPGSYGIQEGGYVGIGLLLGLPADLMIAVSLATRVREIVPSIPLMLAWQRLEGKALWKQHTEKQQFR